MKRLTAFVLSAVIMVSAFPFAAMAEGGFSAAETESILLEQEGESLTQDTPATVGQEFAEQPSPAEQPKQTSIPEDLPTASVDNIQQSEVQSFAEDQGTSDVQAASEPAPSPVVESAPDVAALVETEPVPMMLDEPENDEEIPLTEGFSQPPTRVQWLQQLVALFGMQVDDDNYSENYFSDITPQDDFYRDIMVALEFGVIDLEAGEALRPQDPVTRDFAVQTLNACLAFQLEKDENGKAEYTYSETNLAHPDDAQIALNRGWLELEDGCFLPEQTVSAEEANQMISDAADAIERADIGGGEIEEVDLSQFTPTESVSFYMADGSLQESAVETYDIRYDKNSKTLRFNQKIPVGNGSITLSGALSNLYVEKGRENGTTKVILHGNAAYDVKANVDLIQSAGMPSWLELGTIPVGIGKISVGMSYKGTGDISASWSGRLEYGILYDNTVRLYRSFQKDSFTLAANADIDIGGMIDLGFDYMGIAGDVFAEMGVHMNFSAKTYDSGTPRTCINIRQWLYITCGYQLNILGYGVAGDRLSIWGESNSPVRVCDHYEDDRLVFGCTRGSGGTGKYSTSPSSRYYSGLYGKGQSSYTNTAGQTIPIYRYTTDSSGNATITGYQGNSYGLVIPDTLDGYPVVKIGDSAFKNNTVLRSVVIPDSVTEIGAYAFEGCSNLSSVQLSKNLKTLNNGAFRNCTKLTSIYIPKSLTQASATPGTFTGTGLKEVTFEEGITTIAPYLFYDCDSLESIVIPDTVTLIGHSAFLNSDNLKTVTLSKALTQIESSAFKNTALAEVVIPDGVTEIGAYAFEGCSNLSSVQLSKNLKTLNNGAFRNCTKLTSIYIPKSLTQASATPGAFTGTGLKEVTFEEGITTIAPDLFYDCDSLESIVIPDTVTLIGYSAFSNSDNLKTVTLSKTLTKIESSAFSNTALTEVVIPDSVTEIGAYAFEGCKALSSIQVPRSVISVREAAFRGCTSLQSAELLNDTMAMGDTMFADCSALKTVRLPAGLKTLPSKTFQNAVSLQEVPLPKGLKVIESNAFENCDAFTTIELPETLQEIGTAAFRGCDALAAIRIPDSVTSMRTECFRYCDVLEQVSLGQGLSAIPTSAFADCSKLATIVIPYYVTKISDSAFKNCTSLVSVTIPRNVTSIGSEAFSYNAQTVVYGVAGAYAETWANQNNFQFVNHEVPATKIVVEPQYQVNKGSTFRIPFRVEPADFTDAITCKTASTNVTVTDSQKGIIRADSVGTATVKIAVGKTSVNCAIQVVQPVTSVSVSPSSKSVEADQTVQLTASVSPNSAFNKTIVWSSGDESIAVVDENGLVTPRKKGTVKIYATAQDGSGRYGTCTLTVVNNVYLVNEASQLESGHPYEGSCRDAWYYSAHGAEKLKVTFDARTELEDGFDKLVIYRSTAEQIGQYTGTELAGKTIEIPGDTFKLQLFSDDGANSEWGFKVVEVRAVYPGQQDYRIENGRLDGFSEKTTADTLKWNLEQSLGAENVVVKDAKGEPVSDKKALGTGCMVEYKMPGTEEMTTLKLVLYGDANGDAGITLRDMILVRKHVMKAIALEDVYLRAASPLSYEASTPNPTLRDMILIRKYVMKAIDKLV